MPNTQHIFPLIFQHTIVYNMFIHPILHVFPIKREIFRDISQLLSNTLLRVRSSCRV